MGIAKTENIIEAIHIGSIASPSITSCIASGKLISFPNPRIVTNKRATLLAKSQISAIGINAIERRALSSTMIASSLHTNSGVFVCMKACCVGMLQRPSRNAITAPAKKATANRWMDHGRGPGLILIAA